MYIEGYPTEELEGCREEPGLLSPVYIFPYRQASDADELISHIARPNFGSSYRLRGKSAPEEETILVYAVASDAWKDLNAKAILSEIGTVVLGTGQCLVYAPSETLFEDHLSVMPIEEACATHFLNGKHLARFVRYVGGG